MDFAKYLVARLREPATWASIAVLLAAAHVNVDPGLWATITAWGVVASAALGVVLAETGSKSSGAIAEDVLKAVAPLLEQRAATSIQAAAPAPAGVPVALVGDKPAPVPPKP